jgi:hypothetical protein
VTRCARNSTSIIGPLSFEEPRVTGEMFLAVLEDTALCHIPVGTVLQLDDSPSSPVLLVCFWRGSSLIVA